MFYKQLQYLHDGLEQQTMSRDEYIESVFELAEFHFNGKKSFLCKEIRSRNSLSIQLQPLQMYWQAE